MAHRPPVAKTFCFPKVLRARLQKPGVFLGFWSKHGRRGCDSTPPPLYQIRQNPYSCKHCLGNKGFGGFGGGGVPHPWALIGPYSPNSACICRGSGGFGRGAVEWRHSRVGGAPPKNIEKHKVFGTCGPET